MVETRAELQFIGDQVGLFRAQPSRPKRTCNSTWRQSGCAQLFKLVVERLPVGADAGIADKTWFAMSFGHFLRQTQSLEPKSHEFVEILCFGKENANAER